MTNEEAIQLLGDWDGYFIGHGSDDVNEALDMAIKSLEQQPCEDYISRQVAIEAIWKTLHEYEDKTEKQFQESEDLDVGDWIEHRIFVQNMNDIDRQTILNLPSVQPERKKGKWIVKDESYWRPHYSGDIQVNRVGLYCSECGIRLVNAQNHRSFCPNCGTDMREVD